VDKQAVSEKRARKTNFPNAFHVLAKKVCEVHIGGGPSYNG
jgi:hypothetical protein